MKDYKLSEIKEICKKHKCRFDENPRCHFLTNYGTCRFQDMTNDYIPMQWELDDETDTKET